jgi:hypothetical protein
MKARYYVLGCLALAACDDGATRLETAGPVVVNFTQPFPAGSPDLPGFLPRDQGRYTALGDTSKKVIVAANALLSRYFVRSDVAGAQLDSLRIPRRTGSGFRPMQLRYRVQALAADSFRLNLEMQDTLLAFTGAKAPRLRRYRGYYYTSAPSPQDSSKWTVRRLAVANGYIARQLFNPDSLRLRALDSATVRQQHAKGQLVVTLAPQSRRAIEQVSSYAGLWLDFPLSNPIEISVE